MFIVQVILLLIRKELMDKAMDIIVNVSNNLPEINEEGL